MKFPPRCAPAFCRCAGFDASGMLIDADVVDGREAESVIERLFADPRVAYIHAHNARHGCYSGLIERA